MKRELDDMLKSALTPNDEPDFWLNQKIIRKAKEREKMTEEKKRKTARIPALIMSTAVVLAIGSVSTYAAWKYLTPEQVAEEVGDNRLKEAFLSSDAVMINETQTYGDYQVTLLGLVSGTDIAEFLTTPDEDDEDQTYSVVAIERTDGTPMPETSSDDYGRESFFVSPLIKGYDPVWYNCVTMNGGYTDHVENGILYRISECDNVEIFADHELYLCVVDSTFYDNKAYLYDEASGEIARNEAYTGLNALFSLPLDASKADPDAVAAYIEMLNEPEEENEVEIEENDVTRFMDKLTAENIDEYCEPVESTRQVLTPDDEGYIHLGDWEVEGRGGGFGDNFMLVSYLFPDGKPGMLDNFSYSYSDKEMDSLVIETYTLNEDGTVTFVVYIPKQ